MISRLFFKFRMLYGRELCINIAILLLLSAFAFWKFEDSLIRQELCLTNSGDGIGTISGIFTFIQEVNERGLGYLFTDLSSSSKISFGLTTPGPMSMYWRWNFWILSFFFTPETIYDFNGALGFVLIGFFGFILFRELRISIPLGLIGAVMLMHLDNFQARMGGHLTLATYFGPILLAWSAVRCGKKPTFFRLFIFAACNVLNFQINEYYGYFGFLFSTALFLGYFFHHANENEIQIAKFAGRFVFAGGVFVGLLCLSYPNLIFLKLTGSVFGGDTSTLQKVISGHDWNNFCFYSVSRPLEVFKTSLPWLSGFTEGVLFNGNPEFTFRMGLVPPLFILFSLIFLGVSSIFPVNRDNLRPVLESLLWIFPSVLMFFFAANPNAYISLVGFTYKVAPMFRVSVRAFLYVDLALVVLFVYTADRSIRLAVYSLTDGSIIKRGLGLLTLLFILAALLFGIRDSAADRILKRYKARKLPDTQIYEVLKGKPEGVVVELPIFSPISHPPEDNYIYLYNRTKHGFPIVNTPYALPTNILYREELHNLAGYINSLSPKAMEDLKTTGVRYVVVDRTKLSDSSLRKSSDLVLIADTQSKSIFQMKDDRMFGKRNFLEYFIFNR